MRPWVFGNYTTCALWTAQAVHPLIAHPRYMPDEISQISLAPTCGLDLSLRRLDLLSGSY